MWGGELQKVLREAKVEHSVLEMPDGERSKQLSTVEQLADRMASKGADRNSAVIAFGGGVVGDLAGLLASTWMRGVDFIQIPTTLLAQVDAAIGGKTGVNLRAGKNLLGTFYQPRAVISDPELLSTLPAREFRAGLFEVIKSGIIRDRKLFEITEKDRENLLARDPVALERVIRDCARIKAEVVAADEKESDLRRILNFGHDRPCLGGRYWVSSFPAWRGGGLGNGCCGHDRHGGTQDLPRISPTDRLLRVVVFAIAGSKQPGRGHSEPHSR